jgi:hypothetical protein
MVWAGAIAEILRASVGLGSRDVTVRPADSISAWKFGLFGVKVAFARYAPRTSGMSRRTRQILFALNLLLLAGFSLACIASQFVGFSVAILGGGRGYVFDTVRGEISLWTAPIANTPKQPVRYMFYNSLDSFTVAEIFDAPRNPVDRAWVGFGFGYARSSDLYYGPPVPAGHFAHVAVAPYWFLIALSSVWPVLRIVRRLDAQRTQRRLSLGLCTTCGYDLRATSMRCPGCGSNSPYVATSLPPAPLIAASTPVETDFHSAHPRFVQAASRTQLVR